AWYVVITSDAPNSRSTAGTLSVWVNRNSTEAAGAAGMGCTLLIGLSLPAVVVEDRAHAARRADQRIATRAEKVHEERLIRFPGLVALDHDRDRLHRLARRERHAASLGL